MRLKNIDMKCGGNLATSTNNFIFYFQVYPYLNVETLIVLLKSLQKKTRLNFEKNLFIEEKQNRN